MAINRTPVLKRCRQLGIDPVVLGYSSKKESIRQPKRRRKESEYAMQLREKQKAKFIYGVLEKQFRGYFKRAKSMEGQTGENLMTILETRLDNVVFRLGFARTRKEARQMVTHGHICVNGRRVDIPSFRVKAGDLEFRAPSVVLATGADPRTLGVAGETELLGRGVAYCAACDGMFYKGKTVVVVGGGNSAAADALLLSRVAKKVILVHRRDTLRATKIYHESLAQAENVEFRWNSVVSALLSGDRLTGVRLRDTVTGEESVVDCDGVFVSVGRQPATALAAGQLALDGGGYIVAGETTETSIPGVYAVGDVRTKPLRQVVTAVADGAVAVYMAEKYIAENR